MRKQKSLWAFVFVGGLATAVGFAAGGPWSNGFVFAGVGNSQYYNFDNGGTFIPANTLDNGLGGSETTGCSFLPDTSALYTTDWAPNTGHVVVFDDTAPHNILNTISVRPYVESVVFRKSDTHMFLGGPGEGPGVCPACDHPSAVNRIDEYLANGTPVDVVNNIPAIDPTLGSTGGPDWIDLGPNGCTMFYTSEGRLIQKYDVCAHLNGGVFANLSTAIGTTNTGFGNAYALRILDAPFLGQILVADRYDIKRVSADGLTILATYDVAGEDSWFALNIDPNGTSFWSANFQGGNIYRFNIATGAQEVGPANGGQTQVHGLCVRGERTIQQTNLPGRMTGGGKMTPSGGKKSPQVTHGFELHCDVAHVPNNLEINWDGGNKFHLETLSTAVCSDDPAIDQGHPDAGFDTFTGTGVGRYNGIPGYKISFVFTDAGEPGKNDTAQIVITDSTGTITVLTVPKTQLNQGNQQAHNDNK